MNIIVVGTHEYEWALQVFAHQFIRFWNNVPVTYWGDRAPQVKLPKNFTFKQVPAYAEGIWPWEHWFGNGLSSILLAIPDDLVVIFLPDHWLNAVVNKTVVRTLGEFMRENDNVLRGNLTQGTGIESYGRVVEKRWDIDILTISPADVHCGFIGGMTFAPAIWNRKLLLEILEPHWDLWQCESLGTQKMAREKPEWMSVGSRPGALSRAHGLFHGQPKTAFIGDLDDKAKEYIVSVLPAGWKWKI